MGIKAVYINVLIIPQFHYSFPNHPKPNYQCKLNSVKPNTRCTVKAVQDNLSRLCGTTDQTHIKRTSNIIENQQSTRLGEGDFETLPLDLVATWIARTYDG